MTGGDGLARSGGVRGSFFTGALAAFVATPCTGPFLGFALGAALVLPTWAALAVFAGLGLGLATPFLLLGFVPALRRRLPKPGAWMERFQRILAVPMFVTALGLAWVLGRQSGVDGMALGLGSALLLGLGLWWLGRRQGERRVWLPLAFIVLAIVAPLPFVRTVEAVPGQALTARRAVRRNPARFASRRGVPVFSISPPMVPHLQGQQRTAPDQAEVAPPSRARNPCHGRRLDPGRCRIGRFLERHGRSGVPVLITPPGARRNAAAILTVGRLTGLR